MSAYKVPLIGILFLFIALTSGSKCPQETISRFVVCYYKNETSLNNLNICNCTHLIFTSAVRKTENNSLEISEDAKKDLSIIKEKKNDLLALFTLETKPINTSAILKSENKSQELIENIASFLQESKFDGIELNFKFDAEDGLSKDSYASFIKDLSKTLSSSHKRVKRAGYDVVESVQDDVTTVAYSTQTPKNSTAKTPSIKTNTSTTKKINRKTREEKEESISDEDSEDFLTLEDANTEILKEVPKEDKKEEIEVEELEVDKQFLLFVRLSIKPEIIGKKFDMKALSKYADVLVVPTHDIVNKNEEGLTYHPSRLMGLSDILNTDSILDFLTGIGAVKSKIVITMPATVLKFQLKDVAKNTPRSPAVSKPQIIDQSQLCSLFTKNNWTLERDDDLTAPYAFSGKTWLAFEDETSINIKGKYILLRELAGGAIYPIDADVNDKSCTNQTGSGGYLTSVLYKNFRSLGRKPRALVLESLQEQIHDNSFSNIEAGVKVSEYRIVRVVDHSGAVHVIRKNTKTQFECSRQGYFSHPLGCNKFYRCVKFDQYSDEYTVFEYDCPAGLAFDERWEVCVWPGSLPHGAPCTGSSEIAPVPRAHYQCPNQEGYYADPENCRWFFACLDHARDGITPLTAYEFRCPFGLVFNEIKLACDWPWLVGACGNRGAAGFLVNSAGGASSGIHTATFINGGNLEASFGQFGRTQEEASFNGFGKGFGAVLREGNYQGAQSAGYGYIASSFDDNNNRASFGSLPEYEISGGRILNKGGVVIDQNFNVVGTGAGAVGGAGAGGAGQFIGQYGYRTGGNDYRGRSNYNGGSINVENRPKTVIAQTSGGSSGGGRFSYSAPLSTPRPSSVNVPSVQINEEKIAANSQNSFTGSTTSGNLVTLGGLQNGNIQIQGGGLSEGHSFGFSATPSTVALPVVTQKTTFGETGSGISLSTPAVSFTVTPKSETHRFGQANFKQTGYSGGVSVSQPAVSFNAPIVSGGQSFQSTTGGAESVTVGSPALVGVPIVTPKPGIQSYEFTSSGGGRGISVSQPAVVSFKQNSFGGSVSSGVSVTPQPGISTYEYTQNGGSVASQPVVPVVSFKQTGIEGSVAPGISVTPRPGISSFEYNQNGGITVGQTAAPGFGFKQTQFGGNKIGQSVTAGISVTPASKIQSFDFSSGGQSGSTGYSKAAVPGVTFNQNQVTGSKFGQTSISSGIPIVTPQPGIQSVEYTSGGYSKGLSVSQPSVSVVGFNSQNHIIGSKFGPSTASVAVPVTTPTPITHVFESSSGQNADSIDIAYGQPSVSFAPGISTKTDYTFGVKSGSGLDVTTKTTKPIINSFEQTSIDQEVTRELSLNKPVNSYGVPLAASKPTISTYQTSGSVGTSGTSSFGQPAVSFVTPQAEILKISSPEIKPNVIFGGISNGLSTISQTVPIVTPKTEIHTFSQSTFGQGINFGGYSGSPSTASYDLPVITPKTEIHTFSQPQIKQNAYFGRSGIQSTISQNVPVTPKTTFSQPELNIFGGSGSPSTISYGVPTVSPKTVVNTYEYKNGEAPANVPVINTFEQGYSGVTPKTEILTFGHKTSVQNEKVSYNIPLVTAKTEIHSVDQPNGGYIQPEGQIELNSISPPAFGQQYSYGSSIKQSGSSFQTFGQTSKPERPKLVTSVSIEQQPIVSIGTISSAGYDSGLSTPKPFTNTISTPSPIVTSTYLPPKQTISVTTPRPSISISSYKPIQSTTEPLRVNLFDNQQSTGYGQQKINFEAAKIKVGSPSVQGTFVDEPKSVTFDQNYINYNQEVKSFTPGVQIQQEIVPAVTKTTFQKETNVYLPPVTPKIEVFGSKVQQSVIPQTYINTFGNTGGAQVLQSTGNQDFSFIKSKPAVTVQKVEQVQYQAPVQVSTFAPEIKRPIVPIVSTTEKPFDSGNGFLNVNKGTEFNQFFESTKTYIPPQPTTSRTVVIQQKPLKVVPQKTFRQKQVVKPFYEQTVGIGEQTGFDQGQYVYEQDLNIKGPTYEQKEYVSSVTQKTYIPPVTYTTAKTTIVEQPVVYTQKVEPVVPLVDTSKLSFSGEKTEIRADGYLPPAGIIRKPTKTIYAGGFEKQQPNVVLQSVTSPAPQYLSPLTEEGTIQQNNNFDFQKVKGAQNVVVQPQVYSTPKSFVNIFEQGLQYNTVQNFTSGNEYSQFGAGVQYSINPKIEIPEPPQEYLLGQNIYTTSRPDYSTQATNQFKSTTQSSRGYKTSGYLPPRRKSSKTTVISVGNVDNHEDNIQQLLDKYSGKFGDVVDNDKFVTKVINGEGRDSIEFGKVGSSSTVQYEISSTTARPRSRGRQYHGGITSGLQATNKYEEYEIEKEGQRSVDFGKGEGDATKTTLDLKNLKLDKNKKTVIVVSQVSDANPILIGKLAGQCSCQSNMLEFKNKGKKSGSSRRKNSGYPPVTITNEYQPPRLDNEGGSIGVDTYNQGGLNLEATPETLLINGDKGPNGISYEAEQSVVSSTNTNSPSILSSLGPDGVLPITPKSLFSENKLRNKKTQFRGKTRYLPSAFDFGGKIPGDGSPPFSLVPASEIASTVDYGVLRGDESRSQNEIDGYGRGKAYAGAAFDRYGPGGWRGFDETLQGSVDCKRPGLFRHPKYCNKFYACNYDPWKERYTLHVFNCPIHLTYDSSISACNWPVGGPACADDNLLV